MPPNETDHLRAIRNQLHERRRTIEAKYRDELRKLQGEMRKVDEYAKMLGDLETELPGLLSGEATPDGDGEPAVQGTKIPIGELIDRYLGETGVTETTAADVRKYIKAQGYETSTSTYNGIHENLRRRVERGEMEKVEGKFRVKAKE